MDNITELPDRWYVKWNRKIGKFYDNQACSGCYEHSWNYLSSHNDKNVCILDNKSHKDRSFSGSRGVEITVEQFEKFILNKQLNIEWLWNL